MKNQLLNGKNNNIMNKFKFTLLLLLITTVTFAQKSPRTEATGKVGEVTVTVDYGAPSVRERVIFGDLVPYNKVWRAGANENTTISFDKDAIIKGNKVPAGKYGLFILPSEGDEWTVILSKKNDAWGSNGYSKDNDLIRFKVKTKAAEKSKEQMTFLVFKGGVQFNWDTTKFFIALK